MNGLHASVSSAEEKAVLKESVSTSAVQEELDSPDGVSIEVLSDGGWRIYGKGTGTYDLNDADEIRQGTKDAELRAKAAISKFLSEKIQSEEAVINLSLKVKNLNSGVGPKGESNIQVSKTDAQTRIEVIRSQSSAILAGRLWRLNGWRPGFRRDAAHDWGNLADVWWSVDGKTWVCAAPPRGHRGTLPMAGAKAAFSILRAAMAGAMKAGSEAMSGGSKSLDPCRRYHENHLLA